ncbi:hypothetical protein LEP1GSC050_1196 [Leptospira broomii serovar Hurstbridge str. 5399]|uniref:Uncharacterized protein n=1 Tax=Leptospira broomii serovar Hurstbridge str. 5399 TaxID=1049789 RepID=T0FGZ7_9LEPT|nr:hypothetical protein [Leptospira broomii]EQA46897.1 hypothetical protein LEP1GSC050_1196 [Leptospira broomii serovar Hurstbridge str. 5399]
MKFISSAVSLKKLFLQTFLLLIPVCALVSEQLQMMHPGNAIGENLSAVKKRAELPDATISGSGLKAVAIVGEVDGAKGPKTQEYISNIKSLAKVLKDRGVTVYEFYPPNNPWKGIQAASKGAHFVMYAGHGIGTNLNSPPYAQKSVGGFYLGKEYVSNDQIQSDLKAAKGAIVLFLGACFTAGNMAYDMGVIRDEEAKKRIAMYSEPFLKAGFKGYFATWAPWTAQAILALLFTGSNYGDAYLSQTEEEEVTKLSHPTQSANLYYHTRPPQPDPIYDYAFVGASDYELKSLSSSTDSSTNIQPLQKNTVSTPNQERLNQIRLSSLYSKDE